jgi:hypothetical protein
MQGSPGDPNNFELNVDGVFSANSAAEVFDTKGQKVGQLVCYLANEYEQHHR